MYCDHRGIPHVLYSSFMESVVDDAMERGAI